MFPPTYFYFDVLDLRLLVNRGTKVYNYFNIVYDRGYLFRYFGSEEVTSKEI